MKFLKWIGIILAVLITGLLIFINLMSPRFRMPDEKIGEVFEGKGIDYAIHTESFNGREIRWVEAGKMESGTLMLLFHGAPGGFGDYSAYMSDKNLTDQALMVNMDRLGYGYSSYGKAEPSVIKHAEAAKFVLDHYDPDTIILVGYSYGGPIAGAFAARYPEKIKSLLMLAPVNAPDAEKIFWFNPIINTKLATAILPKMIKVANVEKLNHADALEEIREDWAKIQVPVVHLHCMDDWIAPYEANTNWSRENIPAEQLRIIDWDGNSHFLPNQVQDKVKPVIQDLLDQ